MFERKNSDRKADPKKKGADEKPVAATSAGESNTASSAPSAKAKTPVTLGARAMIGAKVKVKGDIVSSEDLLVEGEVSGTITLTDNELIIGNSGRVDANVNAKIVRVEGQVTGDIDGSERVIICASGNVEGNVSSPRVMLEDGGRFKGSIDMGSNKSAAPAAKPAAPAPGVHSIDKTG